jgi:hypothetical protein
LTCFFQKEKPMPQHFAPLGVFSMFVTLRTNRFCANQISEIFKISKIYARQMHKTDWRQIILG